ncbi:MAG: MFS transporter [Nitrospirae bacterium]|nr:MFS transporter [Nitrospirota bacterium]
MNKRIFSWCLFDFANSSYSAVIAAVIFPVYYTNVVVGNDAGQGDLWWGRAISLSMAIVALTSPILGRLADYSGLRKKLLGLYTLICALAVASLSLIEKGMFLEGFVLIVIANIGMEGGLVFYNSFLPVIASPSVQGRVSAWGFAIGYAGSILSLIFALLLIKQNLLNYVWPMVSAFFIIFALPSFLLLPTDERIKRNMPPILYSFKKILKEREVRKFLLSYLIYEDGVNTVIVFSSIFAATTLKFSSEELIILYLLVQVTALSGAFGFAKAIDTAGPKKVVMLSLVLWTAVSFGAAFVHQKTAFMIIAAIAGIGLGTVQAASRALYSRFIPEGHEAEYFGVYSLVGKSSAVAGPLVFGVLSSLFGSQRPAVLAIALFFVSGLLILNRVKTGSPNKII